MFGNLLGCVSPFFTNDIMKPLSKRKQNLLRNSMELQNHMAQWINIALNRYEWKKLPDTMSARILELSFLLRASAMVADIGGVPYSLLSSGGSDITLYGEPSRAWGYGLNGFAREFPIYVAGADTGKELKRTTSTPVDLNFEAVFGWDNEARYPYINYIINSCLRLADIKRSEDVVRENCKKPAIVTCEAGMEKTVEAAFNAKNENMSAIVLSVGNLSPDSVRVFPLNLDATLMKEFADAYQREQNYLREVFGIASLPNTDKKERLITSEVTTNNEMTSSNEDVRLNRRKMFADTVNNCFGLSISVEKKEQPVERDITEEDDDNDIANDI